MSATNSKHRMDVAILGALTLGGMLYGTEPFAAFTVGNLFMFRDSRGINDVGLLAGDRFQYGGNVAGGSLGYELSAVYPPTGFTDAFGPCGPISTNANFCSNSTGYNANRTATPWQLTFRKGTDSVVLAGPSLVGTDFKVPFPSSVTISSATGQLTPTMSWALPAGYVPDGLRAQVFDKSNFVASGTADIIFSDDVPVTASSFTIPAGVLASNGNYTLNLQVVETRNNVVFTNANAQILTRSNSFFAFSPVATGSAVIHLPQVGTDADATDAFGAPYAFTVDSVGPGSVTFIDPVVAIGYDYAIGAGNPNFASVVLPNLGDGKYELSYQGPGGLVTQIVDAGDQVFFPAGGVPAFSVRGIEAEVGLDPADATAFVTGLTFTAAGQFTGTMTPLTVFVPEVPEPETYALLLAGLGLVGIARRRRRLR